MSGFRIGVASVTFRNKTIEQIVEIAENADVSYVEWGADVHVTNREEAQKARALCDEHGITVSSYGSYFRVGESDVGDWRELCEIASILGASSIRVWLGNQNSEDTDDYTYLRLLEDCRKICDIASEYNILVSPECHDHTFNNNTDAFLKFFADLQRDNFRTYFQSRYLRYDYDIDRIERTYGYIENVHISYRDLRIEQEGKSDDKDYLDRFLQLFADKGFDGVVMIEFTEDSSEESFYEDVRKLREI
jgi:sugar phosphate isomerase/epimerase